MISFEIRIKKEPVDMNNRLFSCDKYTRTAHLIVRETMCATTRK